MVYCSFKKLIKLVENGTVCTDMPERPFPKPLILPKLPSFRLNPAITRLSSLSIVFDVEADEFPRFLEECHVNFQLSWAALVSSNPIVGGA